MLNEVPAAIEMCREAIHLFFVMVLRAGQVKSCLCRAPASDRSRRHQRPESHSSPATEARPARDLPARPWRQLLLEVKGRPTAAANGIAFLRSSQRGRGSGVEPSITTRLPFEPFAAQAPCQPARTGGSVK